MTNPAYEATNSDVANLINEAKRSSFVMEYISNFQPEDIDSDDVDLRFEADGIDTGCDVSIVDQCGKAATLIDSLIAALEQAQQENKSQLAALTNTVELWNEQRTRIAELEKTLRGTEEGLIAAVDQVAELEAAPNGMMQLSNELAEMKRKCVELPDEFARIAENLLSQDNRVTSDPMFCVFQKREIVTDEDYDHDRIVWIDEDGNEATAHQRKRLELLHENSREAPEKWRRIAVKEITDFVTCCFTEQGCKDYLACNGHNLRLPFIYVKSGFRNAEYQTMRNWLMAVGTVEGSE